MYIRNKMLSELDLVVEGPSFISPVPKDSVGEYIYRNLIKNNNEHDALVCVCYLILRLQLALIP